MVGPYLGHYGQSGPFAGELSLTVRTQARTLRSKGAIRDSYLIDFCCCDSASSSSCVLLARTRSFDEHIHSGSPFSDIKYKGKKRNGLQLADERRPEPGGATKAGGEIRNRRHIDWIAPVIEHEPSTVRIVCESETLNKKVVKQIKIPKRGSKSTPL